MTAFVLATDKEGINFCSRQAGYFDVLAIDPWTMTQLEQHGIDYKKMEDYYSPAEHERDQLVLEESLSSVLSHLDEMYGASASHPRPYTGNMFWFFHRLSHLLYISKVARRLGQNYQSFYLSDSMVNTDLRNPDVRLNLLSLPFLGTTVDDVVRIMAAHLPSVGQMNGVRQKKDKDESRIPFKLIAYSVLRRLPSAIKKRVKQKGNYLLSRLRKHRGSLLILQGGYEVEYLQACLPEYRFYSPVGRLVKEVMKKPARVEQNLEHERSKAIDSFMNTSFPEIKDNLRELFDNYHREVVGRLPFLCKVVAGVYDDLRPKGVLYSIGSANVVEDVFAYQANTRGIPIYYFKHGSADTLFRQDDPLNKYMERNPHIKKTIFIHSHKELSELKKVKNTDVVVGGNIERYSMASRVKQRKKRLLYCYGMSAYSTYKLISRSITDYERYVFIKSLLDSSNRFCLPLDIKLNPIDQAGIHKFLTLHINNNGFKHVQIIHGIAIEKILRNYGLIIFDIIATRVLPTAMVLDVPILLYLPKSQSVNEEHFSDLEKRVYIVRDEEDVERTLKSFSEEKLESKWSEEIIDQYIFPVRAGNPGRNIANFIRGESS